MRTKNRLGEYGATDIELETLCRKVLYDSPEPLLSSEISENIWRRFQRKISVWRISSKLRDNPEIQVIKKRKIRRYALLRPPLKET